MSVAYTIILETVHGSRAYNLATETSDTDVKGVVVGPARWYFGYRPGPEQIELSADHVYTEVRKFTRLAVAANPTMLELLWTRPQDRLVVTRSGETLLEARREFLSKRASKTFVGYALGQLRRIKTHRQWLLSPPKKEPLRPDFGLPERTLIPRDQLGAAETLLRDGRIEEAELTPNFLDLMDRERRYRQARKHWSQYHSWKRSRNPERAALEAEFGYDTKHALHLVRLLRMGLELLETGELRVWRDDREELLAIRAGAWPYDKLIERTEILCRQVAGLEKSTSLPDEPNEEKLNALCVQLVSQVLSERET